MTDSAPANGGGEALATGNVRLVSALVLLIGIGLFLALPFVLSSGSVVFLPLVSAFVLTICLAPLADKLTVIGLPNLVASFLSVLLLLVLIVFALLVILQPAFAMIDDAPSMINRIGRHFSELRGSFDWISDLNRQIIRLTGGGTDKEVVVATPSVIEQVAFATPSFLLETLLTVLMTFFMIEARVRLKRRLLLDRASFGASLKAARVVRDVQDRVAAYISTVAVINFGVGVLAAIGSWAIGMDAPIMWGGLAMLLNFLPYLGPLVMVVLLTIVGLGTSNTIALGLVPPLSFLALHAVEANAVTPSILGARFTMNPVAILLAISYFSWIWGVVGALLSVPILIMLTALFEHVGRPNLIGFLFGEPLVQHGQAEPEAGSAQHPGEQPGQAG